MVVFIISLHNFVDCPQYAYIVRYLCYFRDYANPFVLTSTEIVQLIEYLCTIYISKLISLRDFFSIFMVNLYIIVFLVVLKWHVYLHYYV